MPLRRANIQKYTSKWRFPCHGDGWCARISACKGQAGKLMDIIAGVKSDNAGVMAQEILDRVLLDTGGYAMDDMTVVAIGIWEK